MKKFVIASAFALAASTVSALEVGVTASHDYAGVNHNGYGVSIGDRAGKGSIALGYGHFDRKNNKQDVFSAIAGYDLTKVGLVTLSAKGGVAYLDNSASANGYAALVGVGASLPLTKNLAVTLDATRQFGQDRVKQHDGNRISGGLRLSF